MDMPVCHLIASVPCSSWAPADLDSTILYLRGCKGLGLTDDVRQCIPQSIGEWMDPVANKMVDWRAGVLKHQFLYGLKKNAFLQRRFFPTKRRSFPAKRRFFPTGFLIDFWDHEIEIPSYFDNSPSQALQLRLHRLGLPCDKSLLGPQSVIDVWVGSNTAKEQMRVFQLFNCCFLFAGMKHSCIDNTICTNVELLCMCCGHS